MINVKEELMATIRDVPDFPKPGILFKDITPVLARPELCKKITSELCKPFIGKVDAICGIESRGFLFGMMMASQLNIPFIPIRKKGKLPYKTNSVDYALEYGTATIEMHSDALNAGMKVIVHDDLLATGGTADAAAQLVQMQNAEVAGFSFLIGLTFLNGEAALKKHTSKIETILNF